MTVSSTSILGIDLGGTKTALKLFDAAVLGAALLANSRRFTHSNSASRYPS